MKKLGEELSKEEIEEMVKEADADGNGEIEFSGSFSFLAFIFHYPSAMKYSISSNFSDSLLILVVHTICTSNRM